MVENAYTCITVGTVCLCIFNVLVCLLCKIKEIIKEPKSKRFITSNFSNIDRCQNFTDYESDQRHNNTIYEYRDINTYLR